MLNIIESITDADSYRALGRSNTTPGADDVLTLAWALMATRARVVDASTQEQKMQVLAWVREGEADRAREESL